MGNRMLAFWLIAMAALGGMTTTGVRATEVDHESDFKFRFVGPKVGNRIAAVAGSPRRSEHLLCGRCLGRRLEIDGWRQPLGAHLRQAARRRHRRPGGRAIRAEHGLGGHRRGLGDSRQRRDGQWHLQVHRCRQDLDQHGAAASPAASAASSSIPTNPDIVFACVLGRVTGPQQERGVYPHHRRRPALGARAVRGREHGLLRAVDGSAQSAHACSPACGRWRCTPGANSAAARAAASTSPTTAAQRGRASKSTACRKRRWARSTWPSRRPIRNRIYALIQTKDQGSLWRSDDGGENWQARQLPARPDRPRRLLHPPRRLDRQRQRGSTSPTAPSASRSMAARTFTKSAGAATPTTSGSIPPIPIAS